MPYSQPIKPESSATRILGTSTSIAMLRGEWTEENALVWLERNSKKTPITMQRLSADPHHEKVTRARMEKGIPCCVVWTEAVVCERSMMKQGGCYPYANSRHKLLLMCKTPL
jgi:hypothetical protein